MTANIETTIRCNLDCPMCTQKQLRTRVRHNDMKPVTFERLIKKHNDIHHVSFIGGEPFLNRDFFTMMRFLDSCGLTYEITTNGTLITKSVARKLRKCRGLKQINFSIDGLRAYHDGTRGDGVFKKSMESLMLLEEGHSVAVGTVARRGNLKQIPALSVLLAQRRIKKHKIIYPVTISSQDRQKSKKLFSNLRIQGPMLKDIPLHSEMLALLGILWGIEKKLGIAIEVEPSALRKNARLFFSDKAPEGFGCKQLRQYRFDTRGERIICEFIRNEFDSRITTHLSEKLLPICRCCCKLE